MDLSRFPVGAFDGLDPLSMELLLSVSKKLLGVGGRAEESRMGILVNPLLGVGDCIDAGSLSCGEAP